MLGAARGSAQLEARSQAILASVLAARGDTGRAPALLQDIVASRYMDHHVAYSVGAAYAQLRQPAEARLWLSRAAETGFPCYLWFLADPLLAPLRADADLRRLMEQLRESWESARVRYSAPGPS
jgi:lipopolysaccharide biosynthesis regulator YciM